MSKWMMRFGFYFRTAVAYTYAVNSSKEDVQPKFRLDYVVIK